MTVYPDNTVAHYTTRLAHRICNEGEYEVALTELIYPINFNSITMKEPLTVRYDKVTNQMSFSFQGSQKESFVKSDRIDFRSPCLNEAFIQQIGIAEDSAEADSQRLMYIYSDIVSPYLVGDVRAPLLRVVIPKGSQNDIVSETFKTLYYVPVARRGFDTIQIHINNVLGKPMSFAGGKSLAVLHFRRCNESPVLSDFAIR
jgi:hypothetical protein